MMRALGGRHIRGAILLEIVLALGLFLATSMTLFVVVSGGVASLKRSRAESVAADHARNALAMIEAGLARPESLNGPVAPWSGGEDFSVDAEMGSMPTLEGAFEGSRAGPGGAGFDSNGTDISALGSGGFAGGETGWSLEIETEPASVRGLTLVIVRAFETDQGGGEREGGASYTLRQVLSLRDDADGFESETGEASGDGFGRGFEGGFSDGFSGGTGQGGRP